MIFFLNRGLILEQEVVKALKKYFSIIDVPGYYKNFTVSITNEHPFARILLSEYPEKATASLFPVIVATTVNDSKPSELMHLASSSYMAIEPADIKEGQNGEPSAIEKRYMMMTPKKMSELRAAMEARQDKRIYGTSFFIRRRDSIAIEIWAENPQLKNELYELIRLFACGFMREYLDKTYSDYFSELNEAGGILTIFDSSIRGQRSNNFNLDFGIELSGAHITFEADYIIEQSIIDTELVEINDNLLLEVINHVKGYADTTREWIFGPDTPGTGETEEYPANGNGGNTGSG